MKSLVPVTLLIAASLVAGIAVAGDLSTAAQKEVVRYADLDLNRPAGAATLFARISGAARDVCEPLNVERWVSRKCADAALARAIAEVDAPALTDYYMAKTGRQLRAGTSAMLRREQDAVAVDGGAR
jgi:UrcA family protein